MSNSFIIEIGELAVGLLARDNAQSQFHFFASDPRLSALEGRPFRQPRHAERMARQILGFRTGAARGRHSR